MLPRYPTPAEVADVRSAAHALAYVVIAARRHTDIFEWGQRSTPVRAGRGDPAAAAAGVLHLRGGAVHPRRLAGAGHSVGGDTFDYTLDRNCPPGVDHRRRRPPGGGGAAGHPARRRPAQRAAEGPRPRRAGRGTPTTAWPRTPRRASSSPASSCGSTCTPAPRRSSTPGTRSRCACATAGWRRSSCASRRRSASCRASPSTSSRFPLEPGDRIVLLTDGMQERNAVNLDVAAALADTRGPAPARGRPRAGRRGAARDRRRPAGRRHDGLPRLVRRAAARAGTASRAPTPTAPRRPPR